MARTHIPSDPQFDDRVRSSFARQKIMDLFGVSLSLPFRDGLTQQHGFFQAGVLATVANSACGYAALTMMPPRTGVLSIEFKVNLLAPTSGSRFIARGRVLRTGGAVIVCTGKVVALEDGETRQEQETPVEM